MVALQPFYNRIYMKLDSTCLDSTYEFIYKTSVRSESITIIIDTFDSQFIDEVSLFKNVSFLIHVRTDADIKKIRNPYFYFCNDNCLDNISYSDIGVYHMFDIDYTPITKTKYFNIDETLVRNNLEDIVKCLSTTTTFDSYQHLLLQRLKKINDIQSKFDNYIFKNCSSIFLDSIGNFYSDIEYTTKLGNVMTDNIEISLIRYLERDDNI